MDLKKIFAAEDTEEAEKVYEGPRLLETSHLNVLIREPKSFADVREYADAILKGAAVMVCFEAVDDALRNRIFDYLNGVSYIVDASVSKVSEDVLLYAPRKVSVDRHPATLGKR